MRHLRKFNESNNIRTYDKLALTNEESTYIMTVEEWIITSLTSQPPFS